MPATTESEIGGRKPPFLLECVDCYAEFETDDIEAVQCDSCAAWEFGQELRLDMMRGK